MADWLAFAGLSVLTAAAFVLLAHASRRAVSLDDDASRRAGSIDEDTPRRAISPDDAPGSALDEPAESGSELDPAGGLDPGSGVEPGPDAGPAEDRRRGQGTPGSDRPRRADDRAPLDRRDGGNRRAIGSDGHAGAGREDDRARAGREDPNLASLGHWALLANVLLTHGLVAVALVGGALLWAIPPSALGLEAAWLAGDVPSAALGWGVAAGVALYLANEGGATLAERFGVDADERLRELLAPDSAVGWVVLLVGVLPTVAVAEELLFRAALVGALAAGFGLSPWPLAAASSVAFGLGHGAQGRGGVIVTGLLGFALAAAFVASESLSLVVAAHYVVNALEFLVHEGLGVEWPPAPDRPG